VLLTDRYLIEFRFRPTRACMARFRETLWFKKGTEEMSGQAPAGDHERPLEDRYEDDDSISLIDHVQFSVVTGTTQPIRFEVRESSDDADKTMQLVVSQMKRSRGKVYAMLGASMAFAVAVVAMFAA
jgi:hypothetical protein